MTMRFTSNAAPHSMTRTWDLGCWVESYRERSYSQAGEYEECRILNRSTTGGSYRGSYSECDSGITQRSIDRSIYDDWG